MWKKRLCESLLAPFILGMLSTTGTFVAIPAEKIIPEASSPQTIGMVAPAFQRSIVLPRMAQPEAQPDELAKGKLRIGMRREFNEPVKVNRQTGLEGEWLTLPDGSKLWAARIVAEGAHGIRVHLKEVALPKGATLMVYSPELGRSGATVDAEQMAGTREIWMPGVLGDTVILECRAPVELNLKDVSFTLDGVSHLYDSPAPTLQKAGSCHQDVSCNQGWHEAAKGVGRISFVENGSTFVCTGGLLWDNNREGRYFLTAYHCIDNPAVAATMEVYWFYQTARCDGSVPALSEATRTAGGADFVAGSRGNDFALVRLRRSPPPGVFYLSWTSASPATGETVSTVHHPGGKQKRLSVGTKIGGDADFNKVRWSTGVTEPGSSGAPLFNSRGEVVGQLFGGASSCSNPSGIDSFGRFDVTYESVKSWIEPGYRAASAAVKVPQGTFAGLFQDADAPSAANSGILNVKVAAKNRFTGNIRMKYGQYGFTGKFDSFGHARLMVKRPRLSSVALVLQLDSSDSDRITGQVSGQNWSSGVVANRSVYNGVTSKAPQAGRYTMALPDTGLGDGYALATIGKNGRVTFTVKMPNRGTSTSAGLIARDGDYPVLLFLSSKREMVSGWIGYGAGYWSAPDGSVSWVLSNGEVRWLALEGSRFVAPPASRPVLDASEALIFFGGSLGAEFTVPLNSKRKLVAGGSASSQRLSITFNSNGTFSGTATGLLKGKQVPFQGVLLQNSKSGFGSYSSGGYKGQVRLSAD